MRFLQIHQFYDLYLQDCYGRCPELQSRSFDEQNEALVYDGFSAGNSIAPYLKRFGIEPISIVGNALPAQAQWISQRGVTEVQADSWIHFICKRQVDEIKPDVLYLPHCVNFDDQFLSSLDWKPRFVIGWRSASIPDHCRFSGYDLMVGTHSGILAQAQEQGAKEVRHYRPAFPNFMAERLEDIQPDVDVVFSGQWTAEHIQRNEFIRTVAAYHAAHPDEFSLALYIANPTNVPLPPEIAAVNKGARWGYEMYRALRSGRLNINAMIDLGGGCANLRTFEVTGVGSMLLTENRYDIGDYFEPGSEVETFDNAEELIEKIRHYSAHPETASRIARVGQERCLRDHSLDTCAEEFVKIVQEFLPEFGASGATSVREVRTDPAQSISEAIAALKEENFHTADQIVTGILELDTPIRDAFYIKAVCVLQQETEAKAIEFLERELSHFPKNHGASRMLSQLKS